MHPATKESRKTIKRALIAVLVLLLAAGMVACRRGEASPPPVLPATTAPAMTAPPTTPSTTTPTTAAAARVSVLAEVYSNFGVTARYDITGTPEAEILLAALTTPAVCRHGHNPMLGGSFHITITRDDVPQSYAITDCQAELPVLYTDPDTAYHLAEDVSLPIFHNYLSLAEAQVSHVAAYFTKENVPYTFYSEDAAVRGAVRDYLDAMTESGAFVTGEDRGENACKDDLYLLFYRDGGLYEYILRPTLDASASGRLRLTTGATAHAGTPWYEAAAELWPLLTEQAQPAD